MAHPQASGVEAIVKTSIEHTDEVLYTWRAGNIHGNEAVPVILDWREVIAVHCLI